MSGDYVIVAEADPQGAVTLYVNPMAPNDASDNTTITSWSDGAALMRLYGGISQTAKDDMIFHPWPDPPMGREHPDGFFCSFCERVMTEDETSPLGTLWIVERFCERCAAIALEYTRFYAFTDAPLLIAC